MTLPLFFQLISAVCAILAAGCAILAARRAGRWRDSDAAQALLHRIEGVEKKTSDNSLNLKRVERETTLKFEAIKEEIAGLATKEDAARLQGSIDRTCAIADRTEQSVIRLQDFLMNGKP